MEQDHNIFKIEFRYKEEEEEEEEKRQETTYLAAEAISYIGFLAEAQFQQNKLTLRAS